MSTTLERDIIMAYMDNKTFPQTNINDMLPKNPLYVGISDSMDSNNWIPDQGSKPTLDTIDWRTQLDPESSQRIVNKIMDTLKNIFRFLGRRDYANFGRLLKVETKSQSTIASNMTSNEGGPSNNPPDQGLVLQSQVLNPWISTSRFNSAWVLVYKLNR
ncbi:hypothetical protein KIW84_055367 [Lathyrus oleraceus]|uniref:Mediator complex subunit 15 KIX domain-containing protein n=1 Tax=Pisum sativum TaxID=3888 RepID=A0A9D5AJU9_PEA|nr:hypothetical protein KIW84_055367 [Pisum sativum]